MSSLDIYRSSMFNAGSFPIGMCAVLVRYLLDPTFSSRIFSYRYVSGVSSLFIYLVRDRNRSSDKIARSIPNTMRPVSVVYLLDQALKMLDLYLSLSVRRYLFIIYIYHYVCKTLSLFPITMRLCLLLINLFINVFTQSVNFSLKCFFVYSFQPIRLILHRSHSFDVMHWFCARLSDMALFGDLATYFIFVKKWLCI